MASWLAQIQSRSETLLNQIDAVAADQLTPGRGGQAPARLPLTGADAADSGTVAGDAALEASQRRLLQAASDPPPANGPVAPTTSSLGRTSTTVAGNGVVVVAGGRGHVGRGGSGSGEAAAKTAAQLASENKMLHAEVNALQTEVADFATRVRRSQEQLTDRATQLSLAERQLRELQGSHQDGLLSHQQTSARLARTTTELEKARASVAALEKANAALLNDQVGWTGHQLRSM